MILSLEYSQFFVINFIKNNDFFLIYKQRGKMQIDIFKIGLAELRDVVSTAISKKIDFSNTFSGTYDFKKKERDYYVKEISRLLKKTKNAFPDNVAITNKEEKNKFNSLNSGIKELEKNIDLKKFPDVLNIILDIEQNLSELNIETVSKDNKKETEKFYLPFVPKDIFLEVKANFEELQVCFEQKCYRSCIILCGKILEVALHYKYYQITKMDLLEKSPDIGLGNLVAKLMEKGYDPDPGLMQQIHLINQLRIFSVHKKKQIFSPSTAQCQATILYTLDSLKKLFREEK